MSKVTIYDVAREANCSTATVSLALNNSTRIKKETREHIIKVVKQLGYSPNYMARSLSSKTTNTLGLIVPNVENPIFSMMISGIEDYANSKGYNLILGITNAIAEKESFYLDMLQRKQVDGLILFPSFLGSLAEKLEYLNQLRTPIILCGSSGSQINNISYVKCDNRLGSYIAVSHLVDIGCHNIGCIFPAIDEHQFESRTIGYQDALYYHNIPFRKDLIKVCSPDNDSIFNATLTLLKEQRPDGIFCLYDYGAVSVMRAVFCTGLRIPEDIAIIGYDNIKISGFLPISLSSIDTHSQEVGQKAAEILMQRINNPNEPFQQIVLKPDLVIRESTKR